MKKLTRFLCSLLLTAGTFYLSWAQPESESPYSDQAYDPPTGPAWYETPYLWVGLLIFLVAGFYLLFRQVRRRKALSDLRRRQEKRKEEG